MKERRSMNIEIQWKVDKHRKDRRTGAIDPVPRDPYTKYAFEEIERQFHGEKKVEASSY